MKVVGYARYSHEKDGRVVTIESQEQEMRRVCEARGWEFVRLYKDEAVSGGEGLDDEWAGESSLLLTFSRDGLVQLLHDARRLEFDRVLLYNVSRLAREQWIFWTSVRQLEKLGIHMSTCQYPDVDSSQPMFAVLAGVEEGMAMSTRMEGAQTTRRAMRTMAEKGLWTRGEPIGYHLVGSDCRYIRDPAPGEKRPVPPELLHTHMPYDDGEKGFLVPDGTGTKILDLLDVNREAGPRDVMLDTGLTYDQAWKALNNCRKWGRGSSSAQGSLPRTRA